MQSYRPEELFDATRSAAAGARGARAAGRSPHGRQPACQRRTLLLRDLQLPDFRTYAVAVPAPGAVDAEDTRVLGRFLRDVIDANQAPRTFASSVLTKPCRTGSTRCSKRPPAVGTQTWRRTINGWRRTAASLEVLSEHQCQGWLEGYLLTGPHGLFNTYEAFAHIVDSMFNQHAKWLKVTRRLPWRRPIASLNYLLVQPRLAAGSQRLHASGSGLHRRRAEQEGRSRPRLSAAGRQLPAERDGPLPAQPALRQHRRGRQASGAAVADDGRGDPALRRRHRPLGLGEQRRGRRPRSRHGGGRRRADARDAGRGAISARAPAGPEDPRRQRRRSDEAAAGRPSIRTA